MGGAFTPDELSDGGDRNGDSSAHAADGVDDAAVDEEDALTVHSAASKGAVLTFRLCCNGPGLPTPGCMSSHDIWQAAWACSKTSSMTRITCIMGPWLPVAIARCVAVGS